MQTVEMKNPVTNYTKSTCLTNLAVNLWFPEAKAKIDAGTDDARKAKWDKLVPYDMTVMTPPTGGGKYYLVDRPASLMLAHITVPMLTWEKFFAWLKENYPPADAPNSAISEILEKGANLSRITAATKDSTTYSSDSAVWKAVDENKDDIILVAGNPLTDADIVEQIKTNVFNGWDIQAGTYTYDEEIGNGKPEYYTATLKLKDAAFTGDSPEKTLYVVNLGQFKPDDASSGQ